MYLWLQSEPKTLSQTSLKGMLEDFFYLNIIFQIFHCYIFTQVVISTEFEKLYHKVLLSYFVFYLLCVSLSLSQAFIAVEKSFFESIDHIMCSSKESLWSTGMKFE
jgi:Na+/glutamate symporter